VEGGGWRVCKVKDVQWVEAVEGRGWEGGVEGVQREGWRVESGRGGGGGWRGWRVEGGGWRR